MTIDPNPFRATLDKVRSIMENIPEKDRPSLVGKVASFTGVPVAAVCLYLLTFVYPEDEGLKNSLRIIVDFYGYTEIVSFD